SKQHASPPTSVRFGPDVLSVLAGIAHWPGNLRISRKESMKQIIRTTSSGKAVFAFLLVAACSLCCSRADQPTVGYVASARYAVHSRGSPTFLNLGKPYPNQEFTVVIWGNDRSKFSQPPEKYFLGKTISVSGKTQLYRGKPEIIVHEPSQITVVKKSKPE